MHTLYWLIIALGTGVCIGGAPIVLMTVLGFRWTRPTWKSEPDWSKANVYDVLSGMEGID
jgi:hypothetical protein